VLTLAAGLTNRVGAQLAGWGCRGVLE
jgi:hypothetical protein